MRRTIAVVDLASGEVLDRTSNTPTLDVPDDFDRSAGVARLAAGGHLHYATSPGTEAVRPAFARPLSWRALGEQCLVADQRAPSRDAPTRFHLSVVERSPQETLVQTFTRRGVAQRSGWQDAVDRAAAVRRSK